MTVTRIYDGMLWVEPTAPVQAVIAEVLPAGMDPGGTTFPCRITLGRKRVRDAATGKRTTRDWRVGHFLLWIDGRGSPDMRRNEARAIYLDAKRIGMDEIIVHGHVALISGPRIDFRQFGVRSLASIPQERSLGWTWVEA